ncbi:MAG: prolyl-tRNA synthetase associated domain-containing protein [Rhodospirillales bacterium]|nr:MAG: prolyl-tRNA synthetase associated domain-containing protein [Rhodospirillales bacterium]
MSTFPIDPEHVSADTAASRAELPSGVATEADLMTFLAGLGITTETVRHPPVFTVEEAKTLRGDLPGTHIKNLFLKDKKGRLWLVVVDEDRPMDLKDLRRRLGAAPLSFAKPDVLADVLGVEPGSVTPFAALNDTTGAVTVVLDAAVMAGDRLHCHPLINTATTAIAPDDLHRFLRACGHDPLVIDLTT